MKKKLALFGVLLALIFVPFLTRAEEIVNMNVDDNWKIVVDAYAAGDEKDTAEKIDNFIARFKDQYRERAAAAQYLKGKNYYKNRHFSSAKDEFKKLLDNYGFSTYCDGAMYRMGECHYNMGNYNEAILLWESFASKYPGSMFLMEAVYGTSISYISIKEYKKADRTLSDFLEKYKFYSSDERIKLVGGIIDFYLARYKDAAVKLKGVKDNDTALYYLGHSLIKTGDNKDAATYFKKIADNFPKSKYVESALYNKAESFYKGENYPVAVSDYSNYLKKFPDSNLVMSARFKLGSSYFNDRKYDKAIEIYRQIAKGADDQKLKAYGLYLIGEAYINKKDYKNALAAYQEVVNGYPNQFDVFSSAQLKSGWCYTNLLQYDKAQEQLNLFVNKFVAHDDLSLGYYLLGNAYFMQNNYDAALPVYKHILDKFRYTELSEGALLMMELSYTKQEQYQPLITTASHILEMMSEKFISSKNKIRARSYYYLGEAYFKSGMYGPAAMAFQRIVDKYYDSDIVNEARASLAWSYYKLEQFQLARRMAVDVATSSYNNASVKKACEILVAHTYFSEKNYPKALNKYIEYAYNHEKDPDFELTAEALYQQGQLNYIQEYYKDAINAWQLIVDKYPKSKRAAESLYKVSDTYFKANEYKFAILGFQTLMKKYPDSPKAEDAMLTIAQVYYNMGEEEQAVKAFKDFMAKYPDSKKIKDVNEGIVSADFSKAQKINTAAEYLKFVEKYPDSRFTSDALYNAGEIQYQSSKFEEAIESFNKMIELFPNDSKSVNAGYYLAACNESLLKYDDAIAAYRSFLKNNAKHELESDVMFRLATACYSSKKFADAIIAYEKVLEKFPGTEYYANAMYNLPFCYTEMSKVDDAIVYYKRFIKEFPEDARSKDIPMNIANIYMEQKRYAEAIASYTDVMKKPANDEQKTEVIYRIGDVYKTLEQDDKAIGMFNQLMDAQPAGNQFRVAGLMTLAGMLEEKENWKGAVDIYDSVGKSGSEYSAGAVERAGQIKGAYPDSFK